MSQDPTHRDSDTANVAPVRTERVVNVVRYHAELEGDVKFDELVTAFTRNGLAPVFKQARDTAQEKLQRLGLLYPPGFLSPSDTEVLTSSEGGQGILLRFLTSSFMRRRNPAVLDLLLISDGDVRGLEAVVKEVLGEQLRNYSWTEARHIKRLKEQLGEPSPNGKLLADPIIRNGIRRLHDDALRAQLSQVIEAFADRPVQRSALERLEPFNTDPVALEAILRDGEIMQKSFVICCGSCNALHLAFEDQSKASAAISDSGGRCASCGKQQLTVVEHFALAPPYITALKQGLWLESLAGDSVALRTDMVWECYIVGSNEIDVLAVFSDRKILIECKSNFGVNDLHVTAAKAQRVEAHMVLVVTTNEVHQNVRSEIQNISGDGSKRKFHLVVSDNAQTIQSEILKILDEESRKRVERWLRGSGPIAEFPRFIDMGFED